MVYVYITIPNKPNSTNRVSNTMSLQWDKQKTGTIPKLTDKEEKVLQTLQKQNMTVKTLTEVLENSKSVTYLYLRKLMGKDLITRYEIENTKSQYKYTLSEKGKQVFNKK